LIISAFFTILAMNAGCRVGETSGGDSSLAATPDGEFKWLKFKAGDLFQTVFRGLNYVTYDCGRNLNGLRDDAMILVKDSVLQTYGPPARLCRYDFSGKKNSEKNLDYYFLIKGHENYLEVIPKNDIEDRHKKSSGS
jgi:hypothetical protein